VRHAVEVVLFDLAALAAASGLPESEVHARIWESGLDADCDAGRYTSAGAHQQIAAALGIPMTYDTLTSLWTLAFEPRADVLALVDRARAHARTGLLTDNGPILLEAMPSRFPEMTHRFDWLFFSCAMEAAKPSAELFARVIERIGVPPARVLLVDDSPRNVDGARAATSRSPRRGHTRG
jgi:putative hydrolase of the HAD superfamily